MALRLYDNTRINSFKSCPRLFYYTHIRDWGTEGCSPPLIFGSSWHAAMNVLWPLCSDRIRGLRKDLKDLEIIQYAFEAFCEEWVKSGGPDPKTMDMDAITQFSPRTPMVAKEMLHGYMQKRAHIFNDPSFELLAVEKPFALPLDPNDTGLWYVGRLDKVFRFRKRIYCGEHKTTTSYRVGGPFRIDFLESFSPNSQIDGYLYALRSLFGKDAVAVWVDAALVHKTVHDGFTFIPIERRPEQLDAWLWETHNWIDQIEGHREVLSEPGIRQAPYLAAFPKNTTSCTNYGGCPKADLCKAFANPAIEAVAPMGYVNKHWSPFDELKLEQLGFKREDSRD